MAHHIIKSVFLVLITKFLFSATVSHGLTLKPLKTVRRLNTVLNTAGYTDCYFYCNVNGNFLQFILNGEHASFQASDAIGQTLYFERTGYEYTATLLSSEPVENGNRAMNSILIISFRSSNPLTFEVTCSNGSHSKTVHPGPVTNVTNSSAVMHAGNPKIILEYIMSAPIVRNQQTHIFVCGVNHTFQLLQANGQPLTFRSNDELGTHRIASASTYTVYEQGIFIARDPVQMVSILIVVQDTDVEVSCFYDPTHVARLRSTTEPVTEKSITSPPITSPATTTLPASLGTQETTKQTIAVAIQAVSSDADQNNSVIYAVILTALIVVIIISGGFVTAAAMCSQWYKASKRTSKILQLNKYIDEENAAFSI